MVAAAAVAPAVVAPPFNVVATKKRIATAAVRAIKTSAHNRQKKPWSLVWDRLPNLAAAMTLFEELAVDSDSARQIKWILHDGDAIAQWLGGTNNKYVPNVKFDGKVLCIGNFKPKVYAWASYESLEAKFEKKTGLLSLKFRTFLAGTGLPSGQDNASPPFLY